MAGLKERQISVRMPEELDRWLQQRAGGTRRKAAFIRELVERERAMEREAELLDMFNAAAAELTDDDVAARERLVDAFSNRA
jgi:predicted DNA-binding protein